MTPSEKRQAKRIIRNAKAAEANLFTLIEDLQSQMAEAPGADDPVDWEGVRRTINSVQSHLLVCVNLATNSSRGAGTLKGPKP